MVLFTVYPIIFFATQLMRVKPICTMKMQPAVCHNEISSSVHIWPNFHVQIRWLYLSGLTLLSNRVRVRVNISISIPILLSSSFINVVICHLYQWGIDLGHHLADLCHCLAYHPILVVCHDIFIIADLATEMITWS
jgi:hypothetical protein